MSGAGLQELIAVIVQMEHGFVHGNPNLRQPLTPALALVGPAAVPAQIGLAMTNSFGFSGINASLIVARG
ncbi:hypothetical protein ACFQZ4_42925 [Catellatospora coxensis]